MTNAIKSQWLKTRKVDFSQHMSIPAWREGSAFHRHLEAHAEEAAWVFPPLLPSESSEKLTQLTEQKQSGKQGNLNYLMSNAGHGSTWRELQVVSLIIMETNVT